MFEESSDVEKILLTVIIIRNNYQKNMTEGAYFCLIKQIKHLIKLFMTYSGLINRIDFHVINLPSWYIS